VLCDCFDEEGACAVGGDAGCEDGFSGDGRGVVGCYAGRSRVLAGVGKWGGVRHVDLVFDQVSGSVFVEFRVGTVDSKYLNAFTRIASIYISSRSIVLRTARRFFVYPYRKSVQRICIT